MLRLHHKVSDPKEWVNDHTENLATWSIAAPGFYADRKLLCLGHHPSRGSRLPLPGCSRSAADAFFDEAIWLDGPESVISLV
jgi:hypothetical protein